MVELWEQELRSRWVSGLAVLLLLVCAVHPPQGLGIPLCAFRAATSLPCPACGLTRAFSHLLRGDVWGAVFYNPLSLVLFPLCCLCAFLTLAPGRRERCVAAVRRAPRLVAGVSYVGLASLLLYGAGRIVWVLLSGRPSMW
ncbi:MAG: DUF2752 domain-containing protein [Armatimonadetes bacterium]|nr:DUF2752 domain-containing protein [Armatimonadota bacterium]